MSASAVEGARTFMRSLVARTSLREASRQIGMGREQVRRFVAGEIQTPHPRTLAAIEAARERESGLPVVDWQRVPLRSVLPEGVEAATSALREIVTDGALRGWLLRVVRGEYAGNCDFTIGPGDPVTCRTAHGNYVKRVALGGVEMGHEFPVVRTSRDEYGLDDSDAVPWPAEDVRRGWGLDYIFEGKGAL